MITNYEKLRIPDEGGKNDLIIEVNYSDDPNVTRCQILKVNYPDGSIGYLKRDYLMAMLFSIGRPVDQVSLIPKKIQTVRKYQTILGITANKNIQAGEKINVKVDIPLPPVEDLIIEEAKKQLTRSKIKNGIYVPST